jgi:4-amino-4-deoxy-L-arabinose transferase-like glycosyltransferase
MSRSSPLLAPALGESGFGLAALVDRLRALRDVRERTHLLWLGGILLVSLVLRIVWLTAVQPDPRDGRFDDSVWYHNSARLLADGHGYVNYAAHTPTALWAPGYPLVLAGLFRLPGDDVAAARALNVAAGLALVSGVYYLGSRLWDRRAGLIAAAIMAGLPSHIYYSSLVMTEVLFAGLVGGLLCLALAWTLREGVAPWRVFLLGVAAGVVGMVRPEGALLVLAIIAAWAAYHRSLRRVATYVALLVLGMAVLYVPWTVRNIIQLHAPIVGTTGMGQVLLQAHNPKATGLPSLEVVVNLQDRFKSMPLPQREVRMNNTATRESIDYAVHHISRERDLALQRLAWFFRGDDSVVFWLNNAGPGKPKEFSGVWAGRWMAVANVYYYMVIGIMVLGLPFWVRRMNRRHVLIWAPFAIYTAMWAFLFAGEARYHFPLLAVFTVLAGIGLSAFTQRWVPGLKGERHGV